MAVVEYSGGAVQLVERCQRWRCGVQCLKDVMWLWWSIVVVLYS